MAKMGPPSKGPRKQTTVRFPEHHLDVYDAEARRVGLTRLDYIALVMARAHGLEEPAYLARDKAQEELPLGA